MAAVAGKVDLKKLMKPYWQPPVGRFVIVEVPRQQFVMIDGHGDPNTSRDYSHALVWLFSLSYTLKFMAKEKGADYSVAPLEGLWWTEDMTKFSAARKDEWDWQAMIMQPAWITRAMFDEAVNKVRPKLGEPPASLRFEGFEEGLSVQTTFIGPFAEEGPTIARLHNEFLPENGLVATGKHHEIYLSDPRRTDPAKLRTVIRQPARRA